MTSDTLATISNLEEQLRIAIQASDTLALEKLLHDDLIFTNHLGQKMSKSDDIAAHQSNLFRVTKIDFLDSAVKSLGAIVLVTTRAEIVSTKDNIPAHVSLQFTRVWIESDKNFWQVIAAHCSALH